MRITILGIGNKKQVEILLSIGIMINFIFIKHSKL